MTTWQKQNHPPEKTNDHRDGDNRRVLCVSEQWSLIDGVEGSHRAGLAAFVTMLKCVFLSSSKQMLQSEV
jgi:hypothetical protein